MQDLLVIGGGINGAGIARDAAGRGLSVTLVEKGDLAAATSSASTKLFHGGLRYLEYYEFRLVREALKEREVLLVNMPHIARPLRFVLPHHPGLRPAWLVRLGLFLYDHLGGRKILPPTRTLDLRRDPVGAPLKGEFVKGFEYSDVQVDDSRLVVLNARDAADKGADIRTRTRFIHGEPLSDGTGWEAQVEDVRSGRREKITARAIVNAAGPWVENVLRQGLGRTPPARLRLVRGSHIVTRRLFEHDKAYIFQEPDGRIVFAIPFEEDFTLIGTTEAHHEGDPGTARCTEAECDYLVEAVNRYLVHPIRRADIVWDFAGVRPLFDDEAESATAATRDYVLTFDEAPAPLLSVFGGKITTYRRLAENALKRLATVFPALPGPWTAHAPLPGGDFPWDGLPALVDELAARFPFLDRSILRAIARRHGTQSFTLLDGANAPADLGHDFGGGLFAREVDWFTSREWAEEVDDILWRRSKLGLRVPAEGRKALAGYLGAKKTEAGE